MGDDIETRLAAAAEAMREHEQTERRCRALDRRVEDAHAELEPLRARLTPEEQDVARLEGVSLTRLFASLRGGRLSDLERERAEAEMVRYRLAEGLARLEALEQARRAARARLQGLATATDDYAAALDDKERHLRDSGDPRTGRLLAIADERGRLTGEARELAEALTAAREAAQALASVQERLGSAASWSTYDTFFGGGAVSSSIKHDRLDQAAGAARAADRRLAVLRTELPDVGEAAQTAPALAIDDLTRFADIWLDNLFTDMNVRDRINRAKDRVNRSARAVEHVRRRLAERQAATRTRLTALESQRRELLS